jgi:hypothetical protein
LSDYAKVEVADGTDDARLSLRDHSRQLAIVRRARSCDRGSTILPVKVTRRIAPGVVSIKEGACSG